MTMVKLANGEIVKEKFYATKKSLKVQIVNVDNILSQNQLKQKTNSKYLIGYLDTDIRPLILIMSKMSRYVKTFKVEDRCKFKNNKLMSFRIDDDKLLQRY